MGKGLNSNLHRAKRAKNDEFYTRLEDIEREVFRYKHHFENKIIFLNCDDPEYSEFWRYFMLNFNFFKLKKLIATHYDPEKPTYKLEIEYFEGMEHNIKPEYIKKTPLKQNGDFRSPECIELLKESDIVITNPPFSLFREFVPTLIEHNKKFLIIGNKNALTYKEIFPYIKSNELWLGFTSPLDFKQPKGAIKKKLKNLTLWYTNLEHSKRNEELFLYKEYDSEKYPKYDNYDAINVDRVKDIPKDYYGKMGVPITFILNYNPDQFEIIDALNKYSILTGPTPETLGKYLTAINGKIKYVRVIIKRKTKEENNENNSL